MMFYDTSIIYIMRPGSELVMLEQWASTVLIAQVCVGNAHEGTGAMSILSRSL